MRGGSICLIPRDSEIIPCETRLESSAMKIKKLLLVSLLASVLQGCASGAGSALVTGQVRPPIEDHTSIRILTEMPEGAVEIAILKASSDAGWTQQHSLDLAVDELKKQAAKVGANVVVLTGRDTSSQTAGVPVYGVGTVVASSQVEIVQGVAVWLDQIGQESGS